MEQPQLRPVLDEALDTVQAVMASPIWTEAKTSPECHEETPLSVCEQREGIPTVLTGVIDLVHKRGPEWAIVDYKTDLDSDTAVAGKYAEQAAAYERAWGRLVKEPVSPTIVSARTERQGS